MGVRNLAARRTWRALLRGLGSEGGRRTCWGQQQASLRPGEGSELGRARLAVGRATRWLPLACCRPGVRRGEEGLPKGRRPRWGVGTGWGRDGGGPSKKGRTAARRFREVGSSDEAGSLRCLGGGGWWRARRVRPLPPPLCSRRARRPTAPCSRPAAVAVCLLSCSASSARGFAHLAHTISEPPSASLRLQMRAIYMWRARAVGVRSNRGRGAGESSRARACTGVVVRPGLVSRLGALADVGRPVRPIAVDGSSCLGKGDRRATRAGRPSRRLDAAGPTAGGASVRERSATDGQACVVARSLAASRGRRLSP